MQRPDRRDGGKPEKDQQPDDRRQRAVKMGHFPQHQNIERVDGGEMVDQQNAHQTRTPHRADKNSVSFIAAYSLLFAPKFRMNPTESRRVRPSASVMLKYPLVWLPPHAQQHVHGQHRHFIKEVEEEQVQRHEDPDGRRGQDQQEDVEFLGTILDVPGNEDPRKQQNGRGKDQGGPDAIHADVKRDAQFLGPRPLGYELEAAQVGIIGQKHVQRGEQ